MKLEAHKKFPKNFLVDISDALHVALKSVMPDQVVLMMQIILKTLLLVIVFFVVDFCLKIIHHFLMKFFFTHMKIQWINSTYKSRVGNAICHVVALSICYLSIYSVFFRHPKSFVLFEKIVELLVIYSFALLCYRILKAVEDFYMVKQKVYETMALKAVSQTLKILGVVLFVFLGFSVMFSITLLSILGGLSAITAFILLVFRDTILGLITGIHVSTSRTIKVGDWIEIPKYNLEGNIIEINLLTSKILNFDKSISSIPTYDLMSTEVRNHQGIIDGLSRRIKRSIYFNIKSFRFVDYEFYEKMKDVNLISEYLERKMADISNAKLSLPNSSRIINGPQLTNIGLFRKYVLEYLKTSPKVDHQDIMLVRQLEITPQGLPLEIYCFTAQAKLMDFELAQADIFDHIMTAAKEFDLEIMQVGVLK